MLRQQLMDEVTSAISRACVVALLGPRQSGKTTIARSVARSGLFPCDERLNVFDLDDPAHVDRLANPRLALEPLRGLIVIDEIQHRPDLFPMLRVLADREHVDALPRMRNRASTFSRSASTRSIGNKSGRCWISSMTIRPRSGSSASRGLARRST